MDNAKQQLDDAIKKIQETLKPFAEYQGGAKTFKEMIKDMQFMAQLANLDKVVEFLREDPGTCSDQDIQVALRKFFQTDTHLYIIHKYIKMLDEHGFIHVNEGRYSISMKGIFEGSFSSYYKKLKDQEFIDYNLKKISLSSIRFNKYFPMVAAIIAIIAIASPILVRVFWKENVSTYKLHEEQLQVLREYRDSQISLIRQIHLDLNALDTSINALRKK